MMMGLVVEDQRIDYENIEVVSAKHLDLERYWAKFKLWDYVVANNLLESSDVKVRKACARILDDLTIFSYAFFIDDEGNPLRLTAYQDAIAVAALRHDFTYDNPFRYILFKSANQIGKSTLLIMLAIKICMNFNNRNVVMISKSLPQSQFLLSQLRFLLNNSKFGESWKEDVGETANTTNLTFERKEGGRVFVSRIICAPAGEGTLGYPIHHLFPDEIDFYENGKNLFWKVLFARVKKTKGQIIGFSNPNPDIVRAESLLAQLWHGDLFKRKFHFWFLDAPWNTREEYEIDKRNSTSYIFRSTHDGEFPDDLSGAFFKRSEVEDMLKRDWVNSLPLVNKPVYIAADTAKMRDQFVIGVGTAEEPIMKSDKYRDLHVRYVEPLPIGTPYEDCANRMKEIKKFYEDNAIPVARIGYDATGQKTFGDMLKLYGISGEGVDFSRKESNKTQLYADFKMMAENRKIKVVYSEQAESELSGLRFKLTASKKYTTVEADKESTKDDICDMCAIMIHIAVKPTAVPVTLSVV